MKTIHLFLFCFLSCFLSLQLKAETCAVPPADAWDLKKTRDVDYMIKWYGSQAEVSNLWNSLNLDDDLWRGWGFEDVGNQWGFLTRLLNAAYIVRQVSDVAKYYGETHPPFNGYLEGLWNHDWWNFLVEREENGYEPKCCNDNPDLEATHFGYLGLSTNVCVHWAYKERAAKRSSVLIHEATHDDVSHISDDDCDAGGSCDMAYGEYNAQTMEINYLYDAISAYQYKMKNGKPQRKIAITNVDGKQMCSYIPMFTLTERKDMLGTIKNKLNDFFVGAEFADYGTVQDVDDAYQAQWECGSCDTADYTFNEATYFDDGNNKVCNEIYNSGNKTVNQSNRAACNQFKNDLKRVSTTEEYEAARTRFSSNLKSCIWIESADDMQDYCEDQIANAKNVNDIDPEGFFRNTTTVTHLECVTQFCSENFVDSWSTNAGNPRWDDSLGCLDAICGDDDPFCRHMYLTWKGDPDMYLPDDSTPGCKADFLHCYDNAGMKPGKAKNRAAGLCEQKRDECQAEMAEVFEKMRDRIKEKTKTVPVTSVGSKVPPRSASDIFVLKANRILEEDTGPLTDDAVKELSDLMDIPESAAAMYSMDPDGFTHAFGQDAVDQIAAP